MDPVLVIGTGPAGMLTALRLAARGFTVDAVDPRPAGCAATRPQWDHVHHLPSAAAAQLQAWLPGAPTVETLASRGRPVLDRLLWRACRPHLRRVFRERLRTLRFGTNRISVELGGYRREYHGVIDASGAARASVPSLAAASGRAVTLEEGPAGNRYLSCSLSGIDRSLRPGVLAARGGRGRPGALLQIRRHGHAQLTLQFSSGEPLPRTWPDILETLRAQSDLRPFEALRGACLNSGPRRFAARASSRLCLKHGGSCSGPWLALGDSLLLTAPELGQGIGQAISQVALLDRELQRGSPWPVIRQHLDDWAEAHWWQVIWVESFGGLCP